MNRQMEVRAGCADEYIPFEDGMFLNIEEDIQGRDVVTYRCPLCGGEHKSLVFYRFSDDAPFDIGGGFNFTDQP